MAQWIWENQNWPSFEWNVEPLAPLIRETAVSSGILIGKLGIAEESEAVLDTFLQNIISSSAIESERLNVSSVRSSLATRLGIDDEIGYPVNRQSEGLAELLLDAAQNVNDELSLERLYQWHRWLFPSGLNGLMESVGCLRGNKLMQVVSGRIDRPIVHFEAPPRDRLELEMNRFLLWFRDSSEDKSIDPFVRAGIAHFWFVTLHPFEDGNGRLARAIADLAFAQYDQNAIRFFVMSTSILENRKEYYAILEETQRNGMDITNWLKWFLKTLKQTLVQSLHSIDLTLSKTRFWKKFQNESFLPEQKKILNLLLDDKKNTFVNGISAAQYQKITKLSKATATRHLGDLLLRGCLQVSGSGRSTRYKIIFKELTWDKLKT